MVHFPDIMSYIIVSYIIEVHIRYTVKKDEFYRQTDRQTDSGSDPSTLTAQTGLVSRGERFLHLAWCSHCRPRQEHSSNGTDRRQQIKHTVLTSQKTLHTLNPGQRVWTPDDLK